MTFIPAGSFTALVTPFSADGSSVALDRLAEQVRFQAAAGITGVVPCGTTGETPTLTDAEYRAVVETTIETASPLGLAVVPGAGSNATARAVELHRFCAGLGADAALHVTPYYNKPSQEGLYRHFMAVADSADLPVILYVVPARTNVTMTPDLVERLAAHENIVAIKDATAGLALAEETIRRTNLAVLCGDDPLTLPFCSIGARGVISVLSNLIPDDVAELVRACLAGDWETARARHATVIEAATAILPLDVNPVPIKTAMRAAGRDTGAVRLPLCTPADAVAAQIRAFVAELAAPQPA